MAYAREGCCTSCKSTCATITRFLLTEALFALSVAAIVIGVWNKEACPVQYMIPVWLMVHGGFGLLLSVIRSIRLVWGCRSREEQEHETGKPGQEEETPRPLKCLDTGHKFISIFLFIWCMIGYAWIFGPYSIVTYIEKMPAEIVVDDYDDYYEYEDEYSQSEDQTQPNYCNKTCYLYAFWLIIIATVAWICVSIYLTAKCCDVFIACCCPQCLHPDEPITDKKTEESVKESKHPLPEHIMPPPNEKTYSVSV